MSEVKFRVDEKNKVVVCKITNCRWLAEDRIRKYNGDPCLINCEIRDTFVGIARCMPNDKFDVEIGKKIALTRAKAKRCKMINNIIKKYIKNEKRIIDDLQKYAIHKVPEVEI